MAKANHPVEKFESSRKFFGTSSQISGTGVAKRQTLPQKETENQKENIYETQPQQICGRFALRICGHHLLAYHVGNHSRTREARRISVKHQQIGASLTGSEVVGQDVRPCVGAESPSFLHSPMTTPASAWAQCLDSQILTAVSHLSTTIRIRFSSAAQQTALLAGSIKLELSAMQTCISLDFRVPPVCIRFTSGDRSIQ